ncbi:anaphase-promoting complex, subunit 10-domain-containing protein [Annulohypoxylon truncatum]|uniref:anaphase-promoting complex, subunit 10-domain-containing protein n=1 Tax=Annulohypoxylon truncatum TaxID=327061 RepID=UPI002007B40F|nr:anaphase-promoting complex, subunit 10-domain-containing protein [Annulohypoxylon truncatum]KAI1206170.1 anaphase-promoting complex, subunit 10-domain-containing protein [Annulohypoxylon truncatum]
MEPNDIRNIGGSARNLASLRQQQEEFHRRLGGPDRVSRPPQGRAGDPVRAGIQGPAEPFADINAGRPDLFPTPQDHTATEEDTERTELGDDGPDGIEEDDQENGEEDGEEDEEEGHEEDAPFDASAVGLKEISNLASFTVSSYKPGCGVKELRDDDVNQFWQSDGPQPHRLNIHFIKRVEIRAIRLYLDYELDESYTPTKIQVNGGWSPNFTIPFTTMELNTPKGWIDVPIAGAGGGPDGNSMCCWFVRIIVLENHQNGKDTHIRGIKVYALDDAADTAENNPLEEMVEAIDDFDDRMELMNIHDHDEEAMSRIAAAKKKRKESAKKYTPGDGGLTIPDFMREPEIR